MKTSIMTALLVVLAPAALMAAEDEPAAPMAKAPLLAEYTAPDDSLPTLRFFADGLETLNDRCPVRKVRLNPRMNAAYVNGRPVGFC